MKLYYYGASLLLAAMCCVNASKLQMPSFAMVGDRVKLECKLTFELSDNQYSYPNLEHFRWLKDGQEVYKYDFNTYTESYAEDIEGVNILLKESSIEKLVLYPVSNKSGGIWTCEAKTTDSGRAEMSGSLSILDTRFRDY